MVRFHLNNDILKDDCSKQIIAAKTLQSGPLGADVVGSSPGKTQHPVLFYGVSDVVVALPSVKRKARVRFPDSPQLSLSARMVREQSAKLMFRSSILLLASKFYAPVR